MRRCTKCILPETFPGIEFGEDGVCNQCLSSDHHEKDRALGRDKLIERIRSLPRGERFDCVVPLSGGKDSTYILYYVVRDLGLRPVALSYDAGYQVPVAKENVRNACRILSVPIVWARPPRGTQRRLLRLSIQISRIHRKRHFTCTNCESMLRNAAVQTARRAGAPIVFWGSSLMESYNVQILHPDRSMMPTYLRSIGRMLLSPKKLMTMGRSAPALVLYAAVSISQRLQAGIPLRDAILPFKIIPFPKGAPQVIRFYDYIRWDSVRAIEFLKRELQWRHPPGKASRFDCRLHAFGNYQSLLTRGLTGDGFASCRLIRAGKIGRERAMREDQATAAATVSECLDVIDDLGLRNGHLRVW